MSRYCEERESTLSGLFHERSCGTRGQLIERHPCPHKVHQWSCSHSGWGERVREWVRERERGREGLICRHLGKNCSMRCFCTSRRAVGIKFWQEIAEVRVLPLLSSLTESLKDGRGGCQYVRPLWSMTTWKDRNRKQGVSSHLGSKV